MMNSVGSKLAKSTGVAPMLPARASLSASLSTTKTCDAPRSRALWAAIRPTGPAPKMATDLPGATMASSVPWYPVGKMSDSIVKSASFSVPAGSSSRLKSAHGTRNSSACPPQYGPISG